MLAEQQNWAALTTTTNRGATAPLCVWCVCVGVCVQLFFSGAWPPSSSGVWHENIINWSSPLSSERHFHNTGSDVMCFQRAGALTEEGTGSKLNKEQTVSPMFMRRMCRVRASVLQHAMRVTHWGFSRGQDAAVQDGKLLSYFTCAHPLSHACTHTHQQIGQSCIAWSGFWKVLQKPTIISSMVFLAVKSKSRQALMKQQLFEDLSLIALRS